MWKIEKHFLNRYFPEPVDQTAFRLKYKLVCKRGKINIAVPGVEKYVEVSGTYCYVEFNGERVESKEFPSLVQMWDDAYWEEHWLKPKKRYVAYRPLPYHKKPVHIDIKF